MPKKILLADDSITIQKVISITFASEDYDLVVVGDGDSAIKKAQELKPDLVMADVAMPGKTGYEVCEAIKGDAELGGIPVLLLAGTFEPLNQNEAARVKADDHIVKPFESQELMEKVEGLLARAEASKEGAAQPPAAGAQTLEVPEDIWESGDFLGLSEEFEEKPAAPGEGLPDLEFLEGGMFEEAAPEEKKEFPVEHGIADLEVQEEETRAEAPVSEGPKAAEKGPEPAPEPKAAEQAEKAPEAPAAEEPAATETFKADLEPEQFKTEAFKPPPFEEETFDTKSFWADVEPAQEPAAKEAAAPPPAAPAPQAQKEETIETDLLEASREAVSEEAFEELKEASPAQAEEPAAQLAQKISEKAVGKVAEQVSEKLGGAELPREQVAEIVSKVAREVVEEIAWEVIPDLAEELIRNEITRVKEALSKLR